LVDDNTNQNRHHRLASLVRHEQQGSHAERPALTGNRLTENGRSVGHCQSMARLGCALNRTFLTSTTDADHVTVLRRDRFQLSYSVFGDSEGAADNDLVVLVMGTGSPGRVWELHQVPALRSAGYRVATFDSRGVGGSTPIAGFESAAYAELTIDDLVGDVAALVEHLGGGPALVVGTSLGARVTQELALARPDLVSRAVVMAGHARLDPLQVMLTRGEIDLYDQGVRLPSTYVSAVTAVLNLSKATLRSPDVLRDWLDIFEFSAAPPTAGQRAQLALSDQLEDRSEAYRAIRVPMLVMGFADDVMIPAYLCRELTSVIPTARYIEVTDTGHFGYLERPDEVNKLILEFLAG
jgi:pimeloyl-ACP methyl ester carboxylesterase